MKLDIQTLKGALQKKGYAWDDQINIVGIRTTIQLPDVFNDLICVVWKQAMMPGGLSPIDTQKWLKDNQFLGKDGKVLKIDGDFGANSEFAMNSYRETVGALRMKSYVNTTDPGTYYLLNPMSKLGSAVLKPGQYVNSYSIGFHQGKSDHKALVQTGPVTVYRDNDKDSIAEAVEKTETGLFGINLHGGNKNATTMKIGKWSAGCNVFQNWYQKEEFVDICGLFKAAKGNKFTYTLLLETDLG